MRLVLRMHMADASAVESDATFELIMQREWMADRKDDVQSTVLAFDVTRGSSTRQHRAAEEQLLVYYSRHTLILTAFGQLFVFLSR